MILSDLANLRLKHRNAADELEVVQEDLFTIY
jgi:hypothetical protein